MQFGKGKCDSNRLGLNTIGNAFKAIATFLRLPNPENYAGHCGPVTGATLMANSGASVMQLKVLGPGWLAISSGGGEHNNEKKYGRAHFGREGCFEEPTKSTNGHGQTGMFARSYQCPNGRLQRPSTPSAMLPFQFAGAKQYYLQ